MFLSHIKMECIDIVLFSSRSISISYTVQEILRKQSHVDGCLSSAVSQKFRSSPSNSMLFADRTQRQAASHSEIQPHIAKTCKSCCLFYSKKSVQLNCSLWVMSYMKRVLALVVFDQAPMDVWLLVKEHKCGSALSYH